MTTNRADTVPPVSATFGDDVDTPGGRPPLILEPVRVAFDYPWRVHFWPEPDVPLGTLLALRLPFPAQPGQTYLANGWQSWSSPTVRRLGHPDAPPPARGLSRRHLLRLAGAGDASYDFLVTSDGVVGFTSGGGLLVADVAGGAVYAVRRHVGRPHPPVVAATGDGPSLLDDLLDRAGAGGAPATRPVGWSTWKAFWERIDAGRVTRSLAGVRSLAADGLCEVATVDDGWQRMIGDWVPHPDRFPAGLAALADEVHDAGVTAGLWSAPLLASPASELVRRRPDWVARYADGAPVVGADIGHWGGRMWVLDVTRPAVREHLMRVAAEHAAAGFTTFKLDFLYAAADAADAAVSRCRAGQTWEGDVLGADEVTAAVLDAIRAGAGDGVTLLGCGAPLWPSIGKVDWMRVGPDVTRYYRPRPQRHSEPAMVSCLLNGWRAAALRAPMHRRLWGNDPDSLPLAARNHRLTPEKRLGFARWVADSGQKLVLSDAFARLSGKDLAEWRRLVGRSRKVAPVPKQRALANVLSR